MGSCFWTDFVGCSESCATNSPLLNALAWVICGAFYCGVSGHTPPPDSPGINVVDSFDDYSEIAVPALEGAVVTALAPAHTTVPVRAVFRSNYDSGAGGNLAVKVGFTTNLVDPTQLTFAVDYLDGSDVSIVSFNFNTSNSGSGQSLVYNGLDVAGTNWASVVSARITVESNNINPLPAGQTATIGGVTLSSGWDAEC